MIEKSITLINKTTKEEHRFTTMKEASIWLGFNNRYVSNRLNKGLDIPGYSYFIVDDHEPEKKHSHTMMLNKEIIKKIKELKRNGNDQELFSELFKSFDPEFFKNVVSKTYTGFKPYGTSLSQNQFGRMKKLKIKYDTSWIRLIDCMILSYERRK